PLRSMRVALERVHLLGECRLAVCCLVLVHNALARSLVKTAGGRLEGFPRGVLIAVSGGWSDLADLSLEGRLHCLVAQPSLLVGAAPPGLGLNACHLMSLSYVRSRDRILVAAGSSPTGTRCGGPANGLANIYPSVSTLQVTNEPL